MKDNDLIIAFQLSIVMLRMGFRITWQEMEAFTRRVFGVNRITEEVHRVRKEEGSI